MNQSIHFMFKNEIFSFDQNNYRYFNEKITVLIMKLNSALKNNCEIVIESFDGAKIIKFIPDRVVLLPSANGYYISQYFLNFEELSFNFQNQPYKLDVIPFGMNLFIYYFLLTLMHLFRQIYLSEQCPLR